MLARGRGRVLTLVFVFADVRNVSEPISKRSKKNQKIRIFGGPPPSTYISDPAEIWQATYPRVADANDVSCVKIRRQLRVLAHSRNGGTLPFSRKSQHFYPTHKNVVRWLFGSGWTRGTTPWWPLSLRKYRLGARGEKQPKCRFFHFGG